MVQATLAKFGLCVGNMKFNTQNVKVTSHEGPKGEYSYNSTLSLTSALDGVGGCKKSLPPPGFDPLTVQPVVGRISKYTYYYISFYLCIFLYALIIMGTFYKHVIYNLGKGVTIFITFFTKYISTV